MKIKTIVSIININLKIFIKKLLNQNVVPYKILINLTDLCNSRCEYCDIWKIKPKDELALENIKSSFKGIEKDIYWISLSGGEVTLVNYFYEMIDYFKKNLPNLKIIAFTTNALAPNKALQYADYINKNGFDPLITISLDGDEELHDNIRGIKGNFIKCENLYKELTNKKIKTHYGITVSDKNSNFIINQYHKWKNKIKAVTIVHSEGIYNKKNEQEDDKLIKSLEHIYKTYNIKNISEIVELIHIKLSILFLKMKRKKNVIPCDVLNSSLHIMAQGDIKPCMFMPSLGNIKNDNIKEIIKSKNYNYYKNEIKKNNCPKCWMNCYSPHSIMQNPIRSIINFFYK